MTLPRSVTRRQRSTRIQRGRVAEAGAKSRLQALHWVGSSALSELCPSMFPRMGSPEVSIASM